MTNPDRVGKWISWALLGLNWICGAAGLWLMVRQIRKCVEVFEQVNMGVSFGFRILASIPSGAWGCALVASLGALTVKEFRPGWERHRALVNVAALVLMTFLLLACFIFIREPLFSLLQGLGG